MWSSTRFRLPENSAVSLLVKVRSVANNTSARYNCGGHGSGSLVLTGHRRGEWQPCINPAKTTTPSRTALLNRGFPKSLSQIIFNHFKFGEVGSQSKYWR